MKGSSCPSAWRRRGDVVEILVDQRGARRQYRSSTAPTRIRKVLQRPARPLPIGPSLAMLGLSIAKWLGMSRRDGGDMLTENRGPTIWFRVTVALSIVLLLATTCPASAQTSGGQSSGDQSSGGQGAGSQSSGGQGSGGQQSPSSQQNSSAPAGLTSGNLPIESTILAYQGLQLSADAMASAVLGSHQGPHKIIVATPGDVGTMLQLRIVLTQADILTTRLTNLAGLLPRLTCITKPIVTPKKPVKQPKAPVKHRAPPPPNPFQNVTQALGVGSVVSLLQTISTIAAVNETMVSESGDPKDATLIALVAGSLTSEGSAKQISPLEVYVPSVYPPRISGMSSERPNISQTYLFNALDALELARNNLVTEADQLLNPTTCKDSITEVTQSIGSVDAFEGALFTGKAFWVPAAAATPNTGAPQGAKKASGNSSSSSGKPASTSQSATTTTSGTSIQQLLYADLLLHQIALDDSPNEVGTGAMFLKDVYFLSIHALEAGGSQLARQSFLGLAGTRDYFSGGAIAQFGLFSSNGFVLCSGLSYGYRGFIQADDFSHTLDSLQAQPVNGVSLPGTSSNTLGLASKGTPLPQCP
jgi:hypothetical protein